MSLKKVFSAIVLSCFSLIICSEGLAVPPPSDCVASVAVGANNPTSSTEFLSTGNLAAEMLHLDLGYISGGETTITSITITGSGIGNEAEDIESAKLYSDTNTLGVYEPGIDHLVDTKTFSADNGTLTFTTSVGISPIDPPQTYFIIYTLKPSAARGATYTASWKSVDDMAFGACSSSGTPYPSATTPITGGTLTVTYGATAAAKGAKNPAAVFASQGDTGVAVMQLQLTAEADEDLNLAGVTITDPATAANAERISAVKLWKDVNGDGLADSGDVELGTEKKFTAGVETLALDAAGLVLAKGTSVNLLVTYDFAEAATASKDKIQKFLTIAKNTVRSILAAPFSLAGCGGGSESTTGATSSLGTLPEGYIFTDTEGNVITSAKEGETVQIRTLDGKKLLQFVMGATAINLTGAELSRNDSSTYISLPAEGTEASLTKATGLPADIKAFIPCDTNDNSVMVCPAESTMSSNPECTSSLVLTVSASSGQGFTWSNTDRAETDDCTIDGLTSLFSSFYGSGKTAMIFTPSIELAADLDISGAASARDIQASGLPIDGGSIALISE